MFLVYLVTFGVSELGIAMLKYRNTGVCSRSLLRDGYPNDTPYLLLSALGLTSTYLDT